MSSGDAVYPFNRPRRQWLTWAALVLNGILFVVPFLLRVVFAALRPTHILESPNTLYSFLALLSFLQLAFSESWRYLLISLLGIGLILAALVWGRPGRVTRLLLLLILLTILAFPWFYHYEPAVIAVPGHDLRWPTDPGLLDGVVKRVQITLEQRPCTYTLLGWSTAQTLYYQAACGSADSEVWAYSPERPDRAHLVTTAPADLSIELLPHAQVLELVRVTSIYPPEAEPSTRSISVRADGLASPDGRWIALVARHIYGPEDVLIVAAQ